jgi:DNA-binding PadR family transcriptional regulator
LPAGQARQSRPPARRRTQAGSSQPVRVTVPPHSVLCSHAPARVGQPGEASLELSSAVVEIADQHQRFAEVLGALEHEPRLIGGDLQQNAARLAEVDGLGHLSIQHWCRPKAGRGDVRAAILALLREGPRNGYQIMSEIEERSGGAWRPSPGAVYPALQQLADEGLIEAEESGGRRTFRLTDAGRRHVEENPQLARAAWESMADGEPGEIPGLLAAAARLGGSIVQLAHAGTPGQIRAAEQLLGQTRSRIYQILAGDADGEQDEQ